MAESARTAQKTGAKPAATRASAPATAKADPAKATQLEREMDRLSLEQAVRDFEIANGRVVDLTQRLISANQHILELQRSLDTSVTALVELQSRHGEVVTSRAYQVAQKAGALRSLIRR